MTGIHFTHIQSLFFLWLLPLLLLFYFYASIKRKQALEIFAQSDVLNKINVSINTTNRLIKFILLLTAAFLIIFSIARPGWNPKPKKIERLGRDVVFLIDVSKSMLAEDLKPNRLERAKLAVKDCIESLEGDRVALVAFAGTAVMKCPLTLDYGFFRGMVDEISVFSVSRGGTNIGDALRMIMKDVFDDQVKQYKDIILITDGEDQDSAPEFAAEEAGKRGIRILAFGLGDENTGMRIPITDESGRTAYLQYKDEQGNLQEVWSKLDADLLRKLVNLSAGGNYLNVATDNFDLGAVYKQLITSAEKKALESTTIQQYDEQYQFFLLIAFILLILESVIGLRKIKTAGKEEPAANTRVQGVKQ